jgi:hypothetical protein
MINQLNEDERETVVLMCNHFINYCDNQITNTGNSNNELVCKVSKRLILNIRAKMLPPKEKSE